MLNSLNYCLSLKFARRVLAQHCSQSAEVEHSGHSGHSHNLSTMDIEVHKVSEEMASLIGEQFATKRKSALETESSQNENQPSVVSSADGAKILKNRFYYS